MKKKSYIFFKKKQRESKHGASISRIDQLLSNESFCVMSSNSCCSFVVSISLMKRCLLCDKSFGTCRSMMVEHIFWIFLEDCTKELE